MLCFSLFKLYRSNLDPIRICPVYVFYSWLLFQAMANSAIFELLASDDLRRALDSLDQSKKNMEHGGDITEVVSQTGPRLQRRNESAEEFADRIRHLPRDALTEEVAMAFTDSIVPPPPVYPVPYVSSENPSGVLLFLPVCDRGLCWRCGHEGHHRDRCTGTPILFCSRCGHRDRLSRTCFCQFAEEERRTLPPPRTTRNRYLSRGVQCNLDRETGTGQTPRRVLFAQNLNQDRRSRRERDYRSSGTRRGGSQMVEPRS